MKHLKYPKNHEVQETENNEKLPQQIAKQLLSQSVFQPFMLLKDFYSQITKIPASFVPLFSYFMFQLIT